MENKEPEVTFEERLPKHEASLHITHNQHKAYYENIDEILDALQVKE